MQVTHFWVNGELVPTAQATISVLDHGFTVADGVFETLLVENGQVFAIDRHLARLNRSAAGLGITPPDRNTLETAITKVLEVHSELEFGRLRITVTSGAGPLGSDRTNVTPTLVVSIANQNAWPSSTSALLVPWTRNENSPLAGLKTTSYAENVYALAAAKQHGFSEALFCDTSGRLCEGTGTNIFVVSDGTVSTPSDSSGLLRGITRELLIEWASDAGISITERDVDPKELWDADEVFITSSTRDVHPVTELAELDIAGRVINQRSIDSGLMTQNLGNIFLASRSETRNP
jgi:branched-chain amino acid aminotransferase